MIFRAAEDADLIRQAARGNVEAYNLLVSRWEKRVYNYLLRITGNREDSLDLTQDVFLKAYQNLARLDNPERFAPWLYRIAHNEAYSMFRKRRPETDVDDMEPEGVDYGITVGGSSVFPIELSLAVAARSNGSPPTSARPWCSRSTRVSNSRKWPRSCPARFPPSSPASIPRSICSRPNWLP